MTPITRTRIAVALFLPLAAVLLAMLACLPAPVGDPEQSKLDDALTGAWSPVTNDPNEKIVILLKPWDARTYFVQYITSNTTDGKESRELAHFKAWLTTFGDATFITLQPMDDPITPPGGEKPAPFWVVGRVTKTAAGLMFQMVKPDSDLLAAAGKTPTREQLETIIKAHANDNALYGEGTAFKKATPEMVKAALKKIDTIGGKE